MKKILAFGLALILLISATVIPAFAEETAENEAEITDIVSEEEQLALKNEFKIFEALELSFDFSKAYAFMTRAELAAFAVELGGLVKTTDGDTGYSDVPKRHWGFENINTVIVNGFMTGKTEYLFKPNDKATVADGMRVMLGLLGYGEVASDMSWTDSQCYSQAKKLGIFYRTNYQLTDELTPYIIAKLYKNCLDINILAAYSIENDNVRYEEEETQFITKRFGCRMEKGVVYGIDDVSVLDYVIPGKGNIVIDDRIYSCGGFDFVEFLGEEVSYIADSEDDDAVICYMETARDSDAEKISAEAITDYSDFTLSYIDGDKEKSVSISKNCQVILNGSPVTKYDERDFMPYAGNIKLRDMDEDGKFDLVFITHIIYMQVNAAYIDGYLNDGFSGKQVKLEDNDVMCVKDGQIVGFDSLESGNVVGVMPDAISYTDKNYPFADNEKLEKVRIDLSCKMTEGQINVCASDWCTLGDTDFEYSKVYKKIAETYTGYPNVSTYAKVYTNSDGLVVAIQSSSKFTSPGSGIKYAYLLGIQKKDGLNNCFKLKMIVDTAMEQVLETADNYYVNDSKINGKSEIYSIQGLFAGGEVIQQLVAYKTDDSGKVKYLYTAKDRINEKTVDISGNEIANPDLGDENYPGYDEKYFALNYSSASDEYRASFGHRYTLSDNVVVFVLPANREETKLYKVANKNYFTIGGRYPVNIYDVDSNYTAYSMTVDSKLGNTGKINYSLWDGAVSYIISGKGKVYINDDIKDVLKASSYGISSLAFTSYNETSLAPESPDLQDVDTYWTLYNGTKWDDLVPGDVIQIRRNEVGEVSGFRTVFRYKDLYNEDGSVHYQSLDGRTAVDGSIYNTVGKVTKVLADGSLIYNIDPEGKSAGIHVAREKGLERSYNRGKIRVFIFDKAKGNVQTGSLKDVRLGDTVMVRSELGAACEMFVYR